MLNAKELLENFVNKYKSTFDLYGFTINTEKIYFRNAFACICLAKRKIPPFQKRVDIELWSFVADSNGKPNFQFSIEIPTKELKSIPQKMVELIIPYNPQKWNDDEWNGSDLVKFSPNHFRQLILETGGVSFNNLNYDESQEISEKNIPHIKEQITKYANNGNDVPWFYSYFFVEDDAEDAFDEFFNDILPNFKKDNLSDTEHLAEIQARRGQGKYRRLLMNYWDNKCAVTSCDIPETLRASHAMPWADCTSANQRINKYNGFLLNANLDALFDKGLITFDDNGVIEISKTITKQNKNALGIADGMHLRKIDKNHLDFLHYHQENVWVDRKK